MKILHCKFKSIIVIYSQSFYLYINKKEKETAKKRPTILKYCKVSRWISSIQIAFWLQNCQYMIYVWEQSFISAFFFLFVSVLYCKQFISQFLGSFFHLLLPGTNLKLMICLKNTRESHLTKKKRLK